MNIDSVDEIYRFRVRTIIFFPLRVVPPDVAVFAIFAR